MCELGRSSKLCGTVLCVKRQIYQYQNSCVAMAVDRITIVVTAVPRMNMFVNVAWANRVHGSLLRRYRGCSVANASELRVPGVIRHAFETKINVSVVDEVQYSPSTRRATSRPSFCGHRPDRATHAFHLFSGNDRRLNVRHAPPRARAISVSSSFSQPSLPLPPFCFVSFSLPPSSP